MPGLHRPNIAPKISASGKVNTFDGSADTVNLDFLMRQPKGFLKPYWPKVLAMREKIYSESRDGASGDAMSDLFVEATAAGRDSTEYNKAMSLIRSRLVNYGGGGGDLNRNIVNQLVINEILGLGIVQPIWDDPRVHELYINGPDDIEVEFDDGIHRVPGASFNNQAHVESFIGRVLGVQNKTLDNINVEAESRLKDGSRFTAIDKSIAPDGPNVDIRRHDPRQWTINDLVYTGMASRELIIELERYIRLGMSIIVTGGTATGKTTLLSALTGLFPNDKRIVTIEDDLELKVNRNKLLAAPMESRKPGLNGSGGVSLRYLVSASLRLSPSILIIGETRGAEAQDMVTAANTGHQVLSTIHSNNAKDVIGRLEMAITQGGELTGNATFSAIRSAFSLIVQIGKIQAPGKRTRRVISEIDEVDTQLTKDKSGQPELKTKPLWKFMTNEGVTNERGEILGDWVKVGELSPERKAMLSGYDYQKPMNWQQILELENIPIENSMYGHDHGTIWPTASEYKRRMQTMGGATGHTAPEGAEPMRQARHAAAHNQAGERRNGLPQMNGPDDRLMAGDPSNRRGVRIPADDMRRQSNGQHVPSGIDSQKGYSQS